MSALASVQANASSSVLYVTSPVGGLSNRDISNIKLSGCIKTGVEKPCTALELAEKEVNKGRHACLTTGCEVLDQALRGGILCKGITEISGKSSSGKTQFGLQLSLTAQLPQENGGLNAGAIYICTEDAFPSKRLYQMIQNFSSRHGNKLCNSGNLGDKIFIDHVADYDGLMECLTKKVSILLASGAVKLVIIDSVAAHFRSDYHCNEMLKRAKHISSIGVLLYKYSHQYKIPVVCINQVTSFITAEGSHLIPSLGLTWANLVTTRIMLSRTSRTLMIQQDSVHGPLETVIREMNIVHAPHLPTIIVPYMIDFEGMKGFK